eukprot:5780825-Pyramimonas_sp.AAC.1
MGLYGTDGGFLWVYMERTRGKNKTKTFVGPLYTFGVVTFALALVVKGAAARGYDAGIVEAILVARARRIAGSLERNDSVSVAVADLAVAL